MTKYMIGGLLMFAIAIFAYSTVGCDVDGAKARLTVASQKAIDQIDKMLNEWDVKKQKVVNKYDELQEQTTKVREEKVKVEVRYNRAVKNQQQLTSDKIKITKNLKELEALLASAGENDTEVKNENNGKMISIARINALAQEQVTALKLVREQSKQANLNASVLKKNLDLLTRQKETSTKQLAQLKTKLKEIDVKVSTLQSMKAAQTIGSASSINDEFNELTDGVDALLGELEEEMAVEEAKLDQRMADLESDIGMNTDLDDILNTDEDVSSTLSDIQKALQEDE